MKPSEGEKTGLVAVSRLKQKFIHLFYLLCLPLLAFSRDLTSKKVGIAGKCVVLRSCTSPVRSRHDTHKQVRTRQTEVERCHEKHREIYKKKVRGKNSRQKALGKKWRTECTKRSAKREGEKKREERDRKDRKDRKEGKGRGKQEVNGVWEEKVLLCSHYFRGECNARCVSVLPPFLYVGTVLKPWAYALKVLQFSFTVNWRASLVPLLLSRFLLVI